MTKPISIALLALIAQAVAPGQSTVRAVLQPASQRKPAPEFTLRDSAGKTAKLKQYRGKVVLLDFWATWCTGCKHEIPWFVEFQKQFGVKRFAVMGVSLDEEGWKVLKPFLAESPIPYRILSGNAATARLYGIESMPDTFLIDRDGRIAAAYLAGLVHPDDIKQNIKALLSKP